MMPRVFVDEALEVGHTVSIQGEDGHHYSRVLRVRSGEQIALASQGQGYLGEITGVDNGVVQVNVLGHLPSHEPASPVYLVQGLAKGDKIDVIIQHNTELGVAGFLFVDTQRSVVKLDPKKRAAKVERWQKIAREAAGQAQRDTVPLVSTASSTQHIRDFLATLSPTQVFFLDEDETRIGLSTALAGVQNASTVLVVGPEGGWDRTERQTWVNDFGATAVTLGPRTLRTETAGFAAVVAVLQHNREMGG
jgi:16S rRNA (uracil1498-N3)-methyltransferase